MNKLKFYTILVIICLILLPALFNAKPALALDFDPNQIISDQDMNDFNSMNLADIQEFLNNQTGILKTYRAPDAMGVEHSASEIIYNAALAYIINPKWILATLEKEQSLITDPNPTQRDLDWAMGYAVCDSCLTTDPDIQKFKGLGIQVDKATARIRYYYDHPSEFNYQMGKLCSIDGKDVLPFNQATANLFNYTPHLHGNYNFWTIWYNWFARIFPNGTLLRQAGDKVVWLIQNNIRRPFDSKVALDTRYDASKIVDVSKNDLDRYAQGLPIKFPNYSLLRSPEGAIYLIVNDQKKHIASEDVFKSIGYNPDEVIDATDQELAAFDDGRDITMDSVYPEGALLQDKKTGGVFYVEDGIKYPIVSKDVLKNNFKQYKLTKVSSSELDKYITAANGMKLKDGTLMMVKGDNKVYVISDGMRRWIANEATFNQLGYKWTDIISVSDKVASLQPEGDPLDSLLTTNAKMAAQTP